MTKKKDDQIKDLKSELKNEREKMQRVADHNQRLMKNIDKAMKCESVSSIYAKIFGALIVGLGLYLPIMYSEIFSWMLIFYDGEKVKTHLPIYSFLGLIVIFWPQIKLFVPKIIKLLRGNKN